MAPTPTNTTSSSLNQTVFEPCVSIIMDPCLGPFVCGVLCLFTLAAVEDGSSFELVHDNSWEDTLLGLTQLAALSCLSH